MGSFRDSKGSLWELKVSLNSIERARAIAGVDLYGVGIPEKQREVFDALNDVITFANVIYAISKPEADTRGVTADDFKDGLDVDQDELFILLVREIADFFRRRKQTHVADLLLLEMENWQKAATLMRAELTPEVMERMRRQADEAIRTRLSEMKKELEGISDNLPESSESHPTAKA